MRVEYSKRTCKGFAVLIAHISSAFIERTSIARPPTPISAPPVREISHVIKDMLHLSEANGEV
jgi:hypothetical protein